MGCTSSSQQPTVVNPRDLRSIPVNKSQPYRYGGPVTIAQLTRQREEFWATRIDGSRIMWQGIRTAADALLQDDIDLARAILDASGIMTPNGTLELAYDERGHLYKVPIFCLVNPIEITGAAIPTTSSSSTTAVVVNNSIEDSKGSKSPSPRPPGQSLTLKIRINPGDYNLTVVSNASDTVLDLKKLVYQKTITENETRNPPFPDCVEIRQRIMFLGRELKNNQFLGDCKIDQSQVVQIFLRPQSSIDHAK